MAELGLFAEVYAQILLLNPCEAEAYMRERYGEEREAQFYDYAALFGAGVTVTIGTNLPCLFLLFLTRCMPPAVVSSLMVHP